MLVKELMTTDVVTVTPQTPLKEVARVLSTHGIGGAPVVDEAGHVVGVVSESDFLIKERGREYARRSPLHWLMGDRRRELERVEATTAGEAMTAPAVTIEGGLATVREAAIVMAERRINRLPVVHGGRLVGIVTRGDIVRLYLRSDDEIESRVRQMVRAVDGIAVERVSNGVVTLAGSVPSAAVAETTARIVEAIDGVVGVETAALSWMEEEAPTPPEATFV